MRPILWALLLILAQTFVACEDHGPSRAGSPGVGAASPRLVVLSPALAATLIDLGCGDLIVGRHAYDLALDRTLPVCGDQSGIDYEALVNVGPTDVILEWGKQALPVRFTELASQHRWVVRNFGLLTLDDVRNSVRDLHAAYQNYESPRAGRALARDPVADLNRAWSKRDGDLAAAGRVLLLLSATPPAALGPGSFHHQILSALGGTPAIATGSPYIELDAEDVLTLDPDAIVFIIPRPPGTPPHEPLKAESMLSLLGPLSKLDMRAVREGRVVVLDDPLSLLPSTAMARFADDLASALKPWVKAGGGRPSSVK